MAKWILSYVFCAATICHTVLGQCSGNALSLSASNVSAGYITSPGYPSQYDNNLDCTFVITAESNEDVVFASVEVKDVLSDDDTCQNDAIKLYSDSVHTDNLLLTLCDQTASTVKPVTGSSGNVLVIHFSSDISGTSTGFRILYFAVTSSGTQACGSDLGTPSTFTPFYNSLPDTFLADSFCNWALNTGDTTVGYRADVLFSDFGGSCGLDEFTIRDGTESAPVLASICATSTEGFTGTYMSTGRKMHFRLSASSTTGEKYGIFLIYKTRSLTDTTTTTGATTTTTAAQTTTTTTTAAPTTTIAVTPTSCSADGENLSVGFGTTLSLTSPNYPSNYDNSNECKWLIESSQAAAGYLIQITFLDFGIEYQTYCSYDSLKIYDGESTSDPVLNQMCGSSLPGAIISTGSKVLVHFNTDATITAKGFQMTYTTISGSYPDCASGASLDTDATTVAQTITSDGFSGGSYSVNFDQYWVIRNPNHPSATLVFKITEAEIESSSGCIYDKLDIHGGPCLGDSVIHTYCSSTVKRYELTTAERYLIHFHSDGSVTKKGFSLEYYYVMITTTPATTTTTTTLAGPDAGAVVALIKELTNSSSYDNEALPVRDLTEAVQGSFKFLLVGINSLDEVEGALTTTGLFRVQWTDAFLSWIPARKSGIVTLLMPQNNVWRPDIVLLNGVTKIQQMGASFINVVLNYTGNVYWSPFQILESTCSVDLTKFPYDTQACELKFGTYTASSSEVNMTEDGFEVHESFQDNNEWTLVSTGLRSNSSGSHTVVTYTIQLKRNPGFITYYITIPIIVLAIMNIFTFCIPLASGERSGYSITVFLAFVVYLVLISEKLPANSDVTPYLAMYVLCLNIISAITLVVTVIQLKMCTIKLLYYPLGQRIQKFTSAIKKFMMKMICSKYRAPRGSSPESPRPTSTMSDTILFVPYKQSVPARPNSAPARANSVMPILPPLQNVPPADSKLISNESEIVKAYGEKRSDTQLKIGKRSDTTLSLSGVYFQRSKSNKNLTNINNDPLNVTDEQEPMKEETNEDKSEMEINPGLARERTFDNNARTTYHAVAKTKPVETAVEEKTVDTFAAADIKHQSAQEEKQYRNASPGLMEALPNSSQQPTVEHTNSMPIISRTSSKTNIFGSTESVRTQKLIRSNSHMPNVDTTELYDLNTTQCYNKEYSFDKFKQPDLATSIVRPDPLLFAGDGPKVFSSKTVDTHKIKNVAKRVQLSDTESTTDDEMDVLPPAKSPAINVPKQVQFSSSALIDSRSDALSLSSSKPETQLQDDSEDMEDRGRVFFRYPTKPDLFEISGPHSAGRRPGSLKYQWKEEEIVLNSEEKQSESNAMQSSVIETNEGFPSVKKDTNDQNDRISRNSSELENKQSKSLEERKVLEEKTESEADVTWQDVASFIDFLMFCVVLFVTILITAVFLGLMTS